MDLLIFIVLTGATAAYITAIVCRRSVGYHRRPEWRWVLLSTILTAVLAGVVVGMPEIFQPAQWDRGKVSIWFAVIVSSSGAAVVGLVGSLAVVYLFRNRGTRDSISHNHAIAGNGEKRECLQN